MIKIFCDCCGKDRTVGSVRKILSYLPADQSLAFNLSKITVDIKELFPTVEDVCSECLATIKSYIEKAIHGIKASSPVDAGERILGSSEGKVQSDSQIQQGDDWARDGVNRGEWETTCNGGFTPGAERDP